MSGHHLKILHRVKIMQILESSQLLSMNLWIGLITRQSRRDQYWQVRNHKTNTMKETRSWTVYFSCTATYANGWFLRKLYLFVLVQHLVKSS